MPGYRLVRPFTRPAQSIGNLDAEIAASVVASASDIALALDPDGVITDVSFEADLHAGVDFHAWVGLPWEETVLADSRHKVRELLGKAVQGTPTVWREVNHPLPSGDSLLLRYSAFQAKPERFVIALGQSLKPVAELHSKLLAALSAQEAELARLQRTELRYRLLFELSSEPTIFLDAATGRILEANSAAWTLLGGAWIRDSMPVLNLFSKRDAEAIQTLVASVCQEGGSRVAKLRLRRNEKEVLVSLSYFQHAASASVIIRIVELSGLPR